jgi:uncharacterized protein (DUF1501 family)
MKRRHFLKTLSAGGLVLGTAGIPLFNSQNAHAAVPANFANIGKKILVNISLDGGPDFRHLIAPAFVNDESQFGYQYWKHRANAHAIAQTEAAYQNRWDKDFLKPAGQNFGILNNSKWLFDQFEAGNLAVVNNALVSNTRDHAHSTLILEQGDRSTSAHDINKPGWGGRLAAAMQDIERQADPSANVRIASLTHEIRRFCYGPDAANASSHRNDQVLSIRDSRDLGLFEPDANDPDFQLGSDRAVMSRTLKAYYAAKRGEMDNNSPYFRFLQHEQNMREFGDAIKARLIGDDPENPNIPIPAEIQALYDINFAEENNLFTLNRSGFGKQIRNLYDSLAANDIIQMRIASLSYSGWDTHKNQKRYIEQRFEDLFHEKGALATLFNVLPTEVSDNLVIVLSGEFGRQLKANGDNGTDHGRGNSILVIGKDIQGGTYGDGFPADELDKIDRRSPDITGKTAVEHILAAVCNSVEPNTADTVFPAREDFPLEEGVNAGLFVA